MCARDKLELSDERKYNSRNIFLKEELLLTKDKLKKY